MSFVIKKLKKISAKFLFENIQIYIYIYINFNTITIKN